MSNTQVFESLRARLLKKIDHKEVEVVDCDEPEQEPETSCLEFEEQQLAQHNQEEQEDSKEHQQPTSLRSEQDQEPEEEEQQIQYEEDREADEDNEKPEQIDEEEAPQPVPCYEFVEQDDQVAEVTTNDKNSNKKRLYSEQFLESVNAIVQESNQQEDEDKNEEPLVTRLRKKPTSVSQSKKNQKSKNTPKTTPSPKPTPKTARKSEPKSIQLIAEQTKTDQSKRPPRLKDLKSCKFVIHVEGDREIARMLEKTNGKEKNKVNSDTKIPATIREQAKLNRINFEIVINVLEVENESSNKPESKQKSIKPVKQLEYVDRRKLKKANQQTVIALNQEEEPTTIVELGSKNLLELVQLMKKEGILPGDLVDQFAQNHTIYDSMDFLHKFTDGELDGFDYKLYPFTLLDHRRLSELLSSLRPKSYRNSQVSQINKDIQHFLESLYELNPKKYYQLYCTIDKVSKISWWNDLLRTHKDEIRKVFQQSKKETAKPQANGKSKTSAKEHSSRQASL